MNKVLVVLILFVSFFSQGVMANNSLPQSLDEALDKLDYAIVDKDMYMQRRIARIDSLKRLALSRPQPQVIDLYEKIGDEYRRCNIDSAIMYYKKGEAKAKDLLDSVKCQRLQLSQCALLPVKGVVKEAVDQYDLIGENLYPQNKQHYYEVGNRLFYFASSFYPSEQTSQYYTSRIKQTTDSLLTCLDPNSHDAKLYKAQLYSSQGNATMMVAEIKDLIDKVHFEDLVYARAVSHLADYYASQKGKEDNQLYYLALASLSDLHSGTLEGTALQKLGEALYKRGDVDRAYTYLALSLDNAVASGSRIRAMETAEVLPIIAKAYRKKDEEKLAWLMWLIIALIVALVLIVVIIVMLLKDVKKLRELKKRLAQANITKDTYISQFLSLSSIYIEKLEKFHLVVKRKLKANQTADLYTLIESGSMLEEQSQMFYKIFDNAFIHIYPTFVEDVNNLLVPEKRFDLPENKLNTELRILAFLRLGIDDSEQIARFLGLSLNTIYTYRNKLKSKAKNRETFDVMVLKIGSIS